MRRGAIILLAWLLVGCATVTRGTTQNVAVDTPGVPDAVCTIQTPSGPAVVTTPGTIVLARGPKALSIQCTKQCYLTAVTVIPSSAEAMTAGHVILGGTVGIGVDAMSGAINSYPDIMKVAMMPDPACHQPGAPAPARRAPRRPPPPAVAQ